MFNRYFRTYPWWMQLIMFILLIFTMASFFMLLLGVLFPKITGYSLLDIAGVAEGSPRALINAALWSQLISHCSIFLVPCLLFAYWTHPKPATYLNFKAPGKPIQWLLVIAIILSAIPFILYLESVMRHAIPLSKSMQDMQEANDRLIKTFLRYDNTSSLLLSILVMAVVPAIGEELMFRGVLMRFTAKTKRGMWFSILVTSLLFMAMHPNPIGYVPIFLAGVLLGLILYWTGSMWMAILAHFINNGVQVVITAMAEKNEALKKVIEATDVPASWAIISVAATALFIFLLYKNKTPLAPKWYHDFEENEWDQMHQKQA